MVSFYADGSLMAREENTRLASEQAAILCNGGNNLLDRYLLCDWYIPACSSGEYLVVDY